MNPPTGAIRLEPRCILRLTGNDRVRYLNGQLTQDVATLAPGVTRHTCLTDAKGRIQAEAWVSALPDSLLVDAPAELGETLAMRLERYIIADDVSIADESGIWQLTHVLGTDPAQLELTADALVSACERYGVAGHDVFSRGPQAALDALRQLDPEVLDELRIGHGIPVWGRELDAETLPPEAGLEARSVSFTKGCYLGQEVISRIRSAGKTNRSLVRLTLAPGLPADLTGTLLWTAESTIERPAGTLTSWTRAGGQAPRVALGYLARRAAGAASFSLRLADETLVPDAATRC
jgi:folate-binding protein YgfZ